MRRRLVAILLLLPVLSLWAENRIETSSQEGLPNKMVPNLFEVDLGEKLALGFRNTDLGSRDTNEFFLRLTRDQQSSSYDPRDKRKEGMNNPLSRIGAFHVGVVGLETDGSRGNPVSVRAGLYGLSRVQGKLFSVTEFAYQSGTFGGDVDHTQNKGGLYSRLGVRQKIDDQVYAETDYQFAPGTDENWIPRFRLGMSF